MREDKLLIERLRQDRVKLKTCLEQNRESIAALIRDHRWISEYNLNKDCFIIARLDSEGNVKDRHSYPF